MQNVKKNLYKSASLVKNLLRNSAFWKVKKSSDGKSYAVISAKLFISVETVRSHIKKMYKVLQVNNKTEAITKYMKGQIG